MPTTPVVDSRWHPAMVVATALLNLVGAAMLATTLLTWRPDNNPKVVIAVLLAASSVALAWTLVRWRTLEEREVAAMVVLAYAGIAILSWGTERSLAAFANGASSPMLAIFAVWFLSPRVARAIAYGGTAAWVLAIVGQGDDDLLVPALTVVVQVVVATEVIDRLRRRLDRLARTDELTGALNRRGAYDVVAAELARRDRIGTPLSVLILDVDDLRDVNNSRGHAAGDALLRAVADHVRAGLRDGDVLGRLGGDEFLVVLPGADHGVADVVARRIATGAPASWSAGVAQARASDDRASLLARADARMYEQKQTRRGAGQE